MRKASLAQRASQQVQRGTLPEDVLETEEGGGAAHVLSPSSGNRSVSA